MLLPIKIILSLTLAYLLGSIPTAYICGKLYRGIDIRQYGSGNVGATNVFRILGKGPGVLVLAVDILKGVAAIVLVADLFRLGGILYFVLLGIAVVCGHNWTVFLNFKGGKGMATSLGVLIGLTIKVAALRPVLLLSVLAWGAVFLSSGYVSLASLVSAVCLPVFMIALSSPFELVMLGVIFCIFIVLRHRSNIKRLLSREEHRVPLPFHKKSK